MALCKTLRKVSFVGMGDAWRRVETGEDECVCVCGVCVCGGGGGVVGVVSGCPAGL